MHILVILHPRYSKDSLVLHHVMHKNKTISESCKLFPSSRKGVGREGVLGRGGGGSAPHS